MRKVVVLPAPFGPSKPNISPRVTVEADVIDGRESAELRTRSSTATTTWSSSVAEAVFECHGGGRSIRRACCRRRSMKPSSNACACRRH